MKCIFFQINSTKTIIIVLFCSRLSLYVLLCVYVLLFSCLSIIMLLSPIYVVDLTSWCGRWCVRKKNKMCHLFDKIKNMFSCMHEYSVLFMSSCVQNSWWLVAWCLIHQQEVNLWEIVNLFLSDRFQRQHNYSNIIKFTSLDGSCTMNKRYYAKQYWVLVKFKFFGQNKGETWKDN